MNKLITIKEASELLSVNPKTLRRWDKANVLKPVRTFGGHRRYKLSDIKNFIG